MISCSLQYLHLQNGHLSIKQAHHTLISVISQEQALSGLVWYGLVGLVSLLNGISTFVGYLMPKSFS